MISTANNDDDDDDISLIGTDLAWLEKVTSLICLNEGS